MASLYKIEGIKTSKLLMGDVNKDKKINNSDVKAIKNYLNNKNKYDSMPNNSNQYNDEFKKKSDVNNDGIVDENDLSIIKSKIKSQKSSESWNKYRKENDLFEKELTKEKSEHSKTQYTDELSDRYKIENIDFKSCGKNGEIYKSIIKAKEDILNEEKQKLEAAKAYLKKFKASHEFGDKIVHSHEVNYGNLGQKQVVDKVYPYNAKDFPQLKELFEKKVRDMEEEYSRKCEELKEDKDNVIREKYALIENSKEYQDYFKRKDYLPFKYYDRSHHESIKSKEGVEGNFVVDKIGFYDENGQKIEIPDDMAKKLHDNGNQSQIKMFQFLYKTRGPDSAKKYYDSIEESLNKVIGTKDMLKFFKELRRDKNGKIDQLAMDNQMKSLFGGGADGVRSYVQNVQNTLAKGDKLTPLDYKKIMILYVLQRDYPVLAKYYGIGESVGENLIPMVANVLTDAITQQPELGNLVGSILGSLGSWGEKNHKYQVEGYSQTRSTLFTLAMGVSEFGSNLILDKITANSSFFKDAPFGRALKSSGNYFLSNKSKQVLDKFLRRQNVFESFGSLNESDRNETLKGFILGYAVALTTKVKYKDGQTGKTMVFEQDEYEDVLKYLENHNNSSFDTAVKVVAPKFYTACIAGTVTVDDGDKNANQQEKTENLKTPTGPSYSIKSKDIYKKYSKCQTIDITKESKKDVLDLMKEAASDAYSTEIKPLNFVKNGKKISISMKKMSEVGKKCKGDTSDIENVLREVIPEEYENIFGDNK